MLNKFSGLLLYLTIVAAVLFVGWEQPLRYRFMSEQEVAELTHPKSATPLPSRAPSTSTDWRPLGTSLDRAPYKNSNEGIEYTNNIDSRQMGTRSEQEARDNLFKGKGAGK